MPERREVRYPLVYISVLNWNGHRDTEACLASLFGCDYPNYRVLVIDNGSTDGSLEYLRKYGDRVTLLRNETNLGYTGGNNLAIEQALASGAEYVWLLNNDVTVRADALTKLVDAASADHQVGLASPAIYFADLPDRIWNCGAKLNLNECISEPMTDIAIAAEWQRTDPKNMVLFGAALLIRRELIEKIGVLDDRFFAYYEDVDYSIRSLQAGYTNIVVFDSAVYHRKSVELHFKTHKPYFYYLITRNRFLLWSKYADHWRGVRGKLWYTRTVLDWIARDQTNPLSKEATLDALWDVWCGVKGPFEPRRRMPQPLRAMFSSHPRFWRRVLEKL